MLNLDQIQSMSREGLEATTRSLGALSGGAQAAAAQVADYAKTSFEHGSQTAERLLGVRTLDAAFQLHGDYLRTSYEGLVAQATRMGELASATAKEALAPVEGFAARTRRGA